MLNLIYACLRRVPEPNENVDQFLWQRSSSPSLYKFPPSGYNFRPIPADNSPTYQISVRGYIF